jgi:CDP-6-deoxy-D-xylo-4-hexulose-3-dehydrase
MPAVMKIAKKHNLYVLEDNCDGWGGNIGKHKVGSFGDISFTSFHAAHIVAMGQGGGIFTNKKELARKVRMYRDWGRQSDIPRRTNGKKWPTLPEDQDARFIYEKVGYNLGPLELQAAMGRIQLKKTEMIKRKRAANFKYLYNHLKEIPYLIMPVWVNGADPSWFSFPITITKPGLRAKLVEHLENQGIETRSMFCGNVLRHPAYAGMKIRHGNLDEAEYILHNSFWVSCHPRMTQADREYMVQTFNDFFHHYKWEN